LQARARGRPVGDIPRRKCYSPNRLPNRGDEQRMEKVVTESIIENKASTILQSIQGIRGDLRVTFEELTFLFNIRSILLFTRKS
jgi:hypothetical protein